MTYVEKYNELVELSHSDALSAEDIITLAKHYPNNKASKFLDWFTYSDNTIDGQSRKKAYTLFESGLLYSLETGSIKCLQQIHAYLFGGFSLRFFRGLT